MPAKQPVFWIVLVALTVYAGVARADYIMEILSNGQSAIDVLPSQSFPVDILLSSDSGDQHDSAIFRVVFSQPGIEYDSYIWSTPYETGTIWDDSKPFLLELPLVLNSGTLTGPGYPADIVDLELSNVIPFRHALFGEGVLVSLALTVPPVFPINQIVSINVVPDTLANGFDEIPTTPGPALTLHVVPEPASGWLLLNLLASLVARRRGRRA